jgi:hypothetical protein
MMLMFDDEPELMGSELSSISGSYRELQPLKPLVIDSKSFKETNEFANDFTAITPK